MGPQKAHCMGIMHSTAMCRTHRPITTTTTTTHPPTCSTPTSTTMAHTAGIPHMEPMHTATRLCPQLILVTQGTQCIITGSPLPHRPPTSSKAKPSGISTVV